MKERSKRKKIERFLRNGSVTNEEKYKCRGNKIEKRKYIRWGKVKLDMTQNHKERIKKGRNQIKTVLRKRKKTVLKI